MAGKEKIRKIDFDKIYTSNSCGDFKIISYLGRDERSREWIRIKFINTGFEKDVRYDIAMDGKVRDELYGIDFNKEYDSMYYGKFKIIKYLGRKDKSSRKMVRIKFLNTEYEYDTLLRMVNDGNVKDYSVAFNDRKFVSPESENYNIFLRNILSGRWKSMMNRCYDKTNKKYNEYGGIGITVCNFWHSLENYINSMPNIYNFNNFCLHPELYQLDKDYLQQSIPKGNRIYSPETCIFLSNADNANLSMKETHHGYYGIYRVSNGNFLIKFSIKGTRYVFGVYNDALAALSEYNYYYSKYGEYELVPLFNDIPFYLDHETCQKYLVQKGQFQ